MQDLFSTAPVQPDNEINNDPTEDNESTGTTETKDKDGNSVFQKANFDTRKQLNRGDKIITDDMITCDGITIESLEKLGMPIFKYKTQITLHGIYNGNVDRVGDYRYKHLIHNQNKSIGIRYNAIDYAKKKTIYQYLRDVLGHRTTENSTEFYSSKWSKFTFDKTELLALYASAKEEANKINTNLIYGRVKVYLAQTPFMGATAVTLIDVNAIYEQNVMPFIESVTGRTIAECDQYIADKIAMTEENRRQKEEAQRQLKLEEEERRRPTNDAFLQAMKDAGYICVKGTVGRIPLNTVYFTRSWTDDLIQAKYCILTKDGTQKYPREKSMYGTKGANIPEEAQTIGQSLKTGGSGWKVDPSKAIQYWIKESDYTAAQNASTVTSTQRPANGTLLNAGLKAMQYTDKSILIIADDATRPYSADLNKIGKYGRYFKVNGINTAGWICSANNETAKAILSQQ